MSLNMSSRGKNAILGSIVADAASMGLEWIYDQKFVLEEVAGDAPEFREPDQKLYEGRPAYFAHKHKHAGDLSDYGALTAFSVQYLLADRKGKPDRASFESAFSDHFGPGGLYVGYINHVTKQLLKNIDASKDKQTAILKADPFSSDPNGWKLHKQIAEAISAGGSKAEVLARLDANMEKTQSGNTEYHAAGHRLLDAVLAEALTPKGVDDNQVIGASPMPVVVSAAHAQGLEGKAFDEYVLENLSFTHNNATATVNVLFGARWLRDVLDGKPILESLATHAAPAALGDTPEAKATAERLAEALAADVTASPFPLIQKWGLSCAFQGATPAIVLLIRHHLAKSGGTVTEDVVINCLRDNIRAAGDCAGRSVLIGGILCGSLDGVPQQWLAKVNPTVVEAVQSAL